MSNLEPQQHSFRLWLQAEFGDKCRRNPRYSLRAFARLLEMEASSVSQILSGKRNPSTKVIVQICSRLSAKPEQQHEFLSLVNAGKQGGSISKVPKFNMIAADAFAVIADWYHFAILELTYVNEFKSSPTWIAKKLEISPTEAKLAIERLMRLKLLEKRGGRLRKTDAYITNGSLSSTGPALKELQRQVLKKALQAIDEVPQEKKDITSMTMAIDPTRLPEARNRVRKFRRQLCAFLENGQRTQVYHLGLQLYPVSQITQSNGD